MSLPTTKRISTFGENAPAPPADAGSTTITWSNSGSDSRWAIVAAALRPVD